MKKKEAEVMSILYVVCRDMSLKRKLKANKVGSLEQA